ARERSTRGVELLSSFETRSVPRREPVASRRVGELRQLGQGQAAVRHAPDLDAAIAELEIGDVCLEQPGGELENLGAHGSGRALYRAALSNRAPDREGAGPGGRGLGVDGEEIDLLRRDSQLRCDELGDR